MIVKTETEQIPVSPFAFKLNKVITYLAAEIASDTGVIYKMAKTGNKEINLWWTY